MHRISPLFRTATHASALLIGLLLFAGCGGSASTDTGSDLDSIASANANAGMAEGTEANVPSPIQIALSLLNAKAPYNSELLNPAKKADAYSSTFSQAINLGIYQADLGYLIANHQTQEALTYFGAVKKLGDKLGIFGSFEENMMTRAEANLESRDSLFGILSEAFKHADVYMNENKMMAVADLIVVGGWLESNYLVTQTLKTYDSGPLRKRVGEDKLILPEVMLAIDQHKEADYQALSKHLHDLEAIYAKIKIKHEDAAAQTDEATRTVKVNNGIKVRYTPETLKEITAQIETMRKQYVN